MKQLILLVLMAYAQACLCQLKTYSFEEVDSLPSNKKKLLFLYTSWCGICHNMENTTLKNEEVVKLINENYYFIPFNAETKEKITYKKHTFNYIPHGTRSGTHELATLLGTIRGKLSYPTICIINEQDQIIFQVASYLDNIQMMATLKRANE